MSRRIRLGRPVRKTYNSGAPASRHGRSQPNRRGERACTSISGIRWRPTAELTDKPLRVRALAQDFVVFRDGQGKAHCLSNTCTHRGGSLSGGKVVGDHVQCPYHGWQFNGAGQCKRIPSLGINASIPGPHPDRRLPGRRALRRRLCFPRRPAGGRAAADPGREGMGAAGLAHDAAALPDQGLLRALHRERHRPRATTSTCTTPTASAASAKRNTRSATCAWRTMRRRGAAASGTPSRRRRCRASSSSTARARARWRRAPGYFGTNHVWTYIHPAPNYLIHQYLYERPDRRGEHLPVPGLRAQFRPGGEERRLRHRAQPVRRQPGREDHREPAPGDDAGHQHQGIHGAVRQVHPDVPRVTEGVGEEGLAHRHGRSASQPRQGGLRHPEPGAP